MKKINLSRFYSDSKPIVNIKQLSSVCELVDYNMFQDAVSFCSSHHMVYDLYKTMYVSKPGFEILFAGMFLGYTFFIVNRYCHPCCYIRIPKGHKYYDVHHDRIPVYPHGGFTYSDCKLFGHKTDAWYLGWDYGHSCDLTTFEIRTAELFNRSVNSNLKRWNTPELVFECCNTIFNLIVALIINKPFNKRFGV